TKGSGAALPTLSRPRQKAMLMPPSTSPPPSAAQRHIDLRGSTVLVVGGGQGMGESTALLLASAGADVAIIDKDLALATGVAHRVRQMGRNSLALGTDVGDDALLRAAIGAVETDLHPIDSMVTI